MKINFLKIYITICIALSLSCSKQSGVNSSDPVNNNKILYDWNYSMTDVQDVMKSNTLISSSEDELLYSISSVSNGYAARIAYKFQDNVLQMTVIIFENGYSETLLDKYLLGFTYMGDVSSTSIYKNEVSNTICSSYDVDENHVLGFCPIVQNDTEK